MARLKTASVASFAAPVTAYAPLVLTAATVTAACKQLLAVLSCSLSQQMRPPQLKITGVGKLNQCCFHCQLNGSSQGVAQFETCGHTLCPASVRRGCNSSVDATTAVAPPITTLPVAASWELAQQHRGACAWTCVLACTSPDRTPSRASLPG